MKKFFAVVLKVLLAAVLLCLAVFVVMMYVIPSVEAPKQEGVAGSDSWMEGLSDGMYISEVTLPGTHDSATKNVQLAYFSKCQSLDIRGQLDAGFRYLDIRLGVDGDELKLMHGFTNCQKGFLPTSGTLMLDDVLSQCYSFLDAHPEEFVVFAVKYEQVSIPTADFENLLYSYIAKDSGRWLLTDSIPSVGDARGKLVLLRRFADEAGLGALSGLPFIWAEQRGNDDVSLNSVGEPNGSYTLYVQDRFKYDTEDKWNAFTEGCAKASGGPETIALNFLSTNGPASFGHPYKYAKALNPRFAESSAFSGWVILDFVTPALAEHIYSKNF